MGTLIDSITAKKCDVLGKRLVNSVVDGVVTVLPMPALRILHEARSLFARLARRAAAAPAALGWQYMPCAPRCALRTAEPQGSMSRGTRLCQCPGRLRSRSRRDRF